MSQHVVLAGDSIFDNDEYVPGEPGVLAQLRASLPAGWLASKVAVDGDVINDVRRQVKNLPADATDLIVSVGGNDALGHSDLLAQVRGPADLPRLMYAPLGKFRASYAAMLDLLTPISVRLQVCTIYTAIPFTEPLWRTLAPVAIGAFNQVIMEEAAIRGIEVLRLDRVCVEDVDYSVLSPIEPSAQGGQKIVDLIVASVQR
jgi:hypothetical protein